MDVDPFLRGVLDEAGITGGSQQAFMKVFPTMDDLYSSTILEREAIIGADAADALHHVMIRRWRQDDAGLDLPAPSDEEMAQIIRDAGALDSEASLYQSLLIRMAADRRKYPGAR